MGARRSRRRQHRQRHGVLDRGAARARLNCASATTSQPCAARARGLRHQPVVRRDVAASARRARPPPAPAAPRRRPETRRASTRASARTTRRARCGGPPRGRPHRVVDHRLVGLQHGHVGPASRDRVDARPERRAGEQDAVRAGADRVVGEREEAPGHRARRGRRRSRARSADRLSSSRFIRTQSGHARSNSALIGAIECASAWISAIAVRRRQPRRGAPSRASAVPATTRRTRSARARADRTSAATAGRSAP